MKNQNFLIITTKQERYVRSILESKNLFCPSIENIFDLENKYGPKTNVLNALSSEYSMIHFVEDRYETLLAVQEKCPHILNKVKLYLAGNAVSYVADDVMKC